MRTRILAAAALLLAGCATSPPREALTRFDGQYRGTETPDASNPTCAGAPRPIAFDIVGDTIRLRSRSRTQLTGIVHADGNFEMADAIGQNEITGTVRDNRLSASGSSTPAHGRRVHRDDALRTACLSTIDATLVAPDR